MCSLFVVDWLDRRAFKGFWNDVYAERGYTGVSIGDWNSQKRVCKFTVPGKVMADTAIIEDQEIVVGGGSGGGGVSPSASSAASAVLSTAKTPEVSCGTLFHSQVQYQITAGPSSSEAAESTILRVSGGITWYPNMKACLVKGKITRTVQQSMRETIAELPGRIRAHFGLTPASNAPTTPTTTLLSASSPPPAAGETGIANDSLAVEILPTSAIESGEDRFNAASGSGSGSVVPIVVPIVVVGLLAGLVAFIVYRRRHANTHGGLDNEGGAAAQSYVNPAYDSSPGDANGNLEIVVESGGAAAAPVTARKETPAKRGSFRMAKKDKTGLTDGPSGPPEWADPDPDVPFLSRTVAEKTLGAGGVTNGSFVVRQTKSVVKGYVVTSCFDGNMANSQLKNKGGGTSALHYGGVKVGDTLEEALRSLQTSTKVSSIGGVDPYLLTHRISMPASTPASASTASKTRGKEEKEKGKKNKEKEKEKEKEKSTKAKAVVQAAPTAAAGNDSDEVDLDNMLNDEGDFEC